MTDAISTEAKKEEPRKIDISEFGSGVIVVATGNLGRYREFDLALRQLIAPQGTEIQFRMGVNIANHFNEGLNALLKNPNHQWLWFMGDDHAFEPQLLIKLLDRRVDCVTPFCLRRAHPFLTVLHSDYDKDYVNISADRFKGKSGLQDISGLTVGNAGTLLSRSAAKKLASYLEGRHKEIQPHHENIRPFLADTGMTDLEIYGAMTSFRESMAPVFENGRTHPEMGGSDLYFFSKLNAAGIPHYLDLDNVIGHIMHCAVFPMQIKEGPNAGIWGANVRTP